MVKNLPAKAGDLGDVELILGLGREGPWSRNCQLTPVLLPGKYHGQRTLAGYSPWGHRVGHNQVHMQSKNESITFVSPKTVGCQAPLSMEFTREKHWSG